MNPHRMRLLFSGIPFALAVLSGCGATHDTGSPAAKQIDCMARAMYFESNRSSRDGMVAVGSVVMNRVGSDDFPDTVCAVVGQKRQFAPGVMTRRMTGDSERLARETAKMVLEGERHPRTAKARFFHAKNYVPNFNNIHYVVSTGGNAFYEKRHPTLVTRRTPPANVEGLTGR